MARYVVMEWDPRTREVEADDAAAAVRKQFGEPELGKEYIAFEITKNIHFFRGARALYDRWSKKLV